jgi:hypothetical protein
LASLQLLVLLLELSILISQLLQFPGCLGLKVGLDNQLLQFKQELGGEGLVACGVVAVSGEKLLCVLARKLVCCWRDNTRCFLPLLARRA